MPVDPVCGMKVEENTKWKAEYAGIVYYFCCEHCLSMFLKDPMRYVKQYE